MRIQELLLEYDARKVESLAPLYASRAKDLSAPNTTSVTELADILKKQVGIKSNEFLYWILKSYLSTTSKGTYGIARWEDIPGRVVDALNKYTNLKNRNQVPVEKRDIQKIDGLISLEDLVDKLSQTRSKTQQQSDLDQRMFQDGDAKLVYNDEHIKVVTPLTMKGSCHFGINTKWCTTHSDPKLNMHGAYHAGGNLYYVLIKSENKRFAFFWMTNPRGYVSQMVTDTSPYSDEELRDLVSGLPGGGNQFMDERDEPINPHNLATKYPVLWKIFGPIAQKNNSLILNPDPSLELQKSEVARNPELIQYIKNPSLAVQALAVAHDPSSIRYIKNPDPALGKHADVIRSRLEREQKAARDAAKAAEEIKKKQERRERLIRTFKTEIMQSDMPDTLDYYVKEIQTKTQNQVFDTLDQKQLNQLIQLQRLRLQNKLTPDDVNKAVKSGVIDADQAQNFKKYPTAALLPGRQTISGPSLRG